MAETHSWSVAIDERAAAGVNQTDYKRQRVVLIRSIVLIGFVVAVGFHAICGSLLHLSYPYNTFLFNPADRFMDFYKTAYLANVNAEHS